MNGYYPVLCVDFRVVVGVDFGAAVGAGVGLDVTVSVGTVVSPRGVNIPARFAETALCIILTFHNAS
jgi:hypothetical protein